MKKPAESIAGSTATLSVVFSRFPTLGRTGMAPAELPPGPALQPAPKSATEMAISNAGRRCLLLSIESPQLSAVSDPFSTPHRQVSDECLGFAARQPKVPKQV